ncbi:hypothetical protein [Williamsia sp. DF01-3]|uniref:hypothetical protein n=1 Tax=Williamsia sp. DF01-3 TaxID=2934157 RepID=UPI001FF184C4|nr:hypothetical protein [Williamsia sp. DF01-3]MCK0518941.1 hypothetical protein [Williamsia sp. DF01-3]
MSSLLDISRKATRARLLTLGRSAHRMTPDELDLMDRLLDEYTRKSRAWHRAAREQDETND